jgi:protein-L-isoaspartate(D-aspartate) O-methyltransferase
MDRPAGTPAQRHSYHAEARARMVERHLAARGLDDPAVLRAMGDVPREAFIPAELARYAYEDRPLPIGEEQTISQPYMVAFMTEAARLRPTDRVLEVGTGSGYAAAVFSRIAADVFTVERHARLAREAEARFDELGYDNIHVAVRDGTLGWPQYAPYDAIIVAAGGPGEVPRPLKDQLAPGGRLIIPRGETKLGQDLVRITRSLDGESFREEQLGAVRFVPLIGEAGWSAGDDPAWGGGGGRGRGSSPPRGPDRGGQPRDVGVLEPLLLRIAPPPVRRVDLVRPERGGHPHRR